VLKASQIATMKVVTEDPSGWGVTIKEGAPTMQDDCHLFHSNIQLDNGNENIHIRMLSTEWPKAVSARPHMPSSSQIN